MDWSGNAPGIPGTDIFTGPYNHYDMELYAWTGVYDTFSDAVAHNAYAAYSGIFSQYVGFGMPPPIPGDLTNMPAMIMKHVLPGDANLDGTVNINDLSKVLTNYDKTGMQWADGDFDGNGTVDINDLSKVLTNYDKNRRSVRRRHHGRAGTIHAALGGHRLVGLLAYTWRKQKRAKQ